MSVTTLEIVRRVECSNCPHYRYRSDTCAYLIKHTGKKGRLNHAAGIVNPRSRCPDKDYRRWTSVPSYHAWYLFVWHMHLDDNELHFFTKFGIHWLKPFGTVELLYSKYRKKQIMAEQIGAPLPPLPEKRSLLLNEFILLSRTPNDYRHCDKDTYDIIDTEPTRLTSSNL